MTLPEILQRLTDNGGAVLYWQVPDAADWQAAEKRGDIWFDPCTDLYVHPAAVRIGVDAYAMPD